MHYHCEACCKKVSLYSWGMISLWRCDFWTSGLAYDNRANTTLWLGHVITIFILFTSSIKVGPASTYYWETSYFLSQTWGYNIYYYCTPAIFATIFCLGVKNTISLLSLNLSSSCLLSLQCLSKFVTLSYYCLILLRDYSISISFCQITLFISLLNYSINGLPS